MNFDTNWHEPNLNWRKASKRKPSWHIKHKWFQHLDFFLRTLESVLDYVGADILYDILFNRKHVFSDQMIISWSASWLPQYFSVFQFSYFNGYCVICFGFYCKQLSNSLLKNYCNYQLICLYFQFSCFTGTNLLFLCFKENHIIVTN